MPPPLLDIATKTAFQGLQLVLCPDHARLRDAFLGSFGGVSKPGTNQCLHDSLERGIQGLAGREDGAYAV